MEEPEFRPAKIKVPTILLQLYNIKFLLFEPLRPVEVGDSRAVSLL